MLNAVAAHNPRSRAHVRHRRRKIETIGRVSRDADFDGTGPFFADSIDDHLENFVAPQRAIRQNDAVIELLGGPERLIL